MKDDEVDDRTLDADDDVDELSEEDLTGSDTDLRKEDSQGDPKGATLEKRFKDTQAKLTKTATEKAELEKSLAQLTGKVDALVSMSNKSETREAAEDPFKFLDDEEEVNNLLDDPKNVAKALKRTLAGIARVLEDRDRFVLGEIDRRDPTVREVREKVEELRKDSDYQGFSDKQLAVIVKKGLVKAPKADEEEDDDDGFRGGVGGGRKVAVARKRDKDAEVTSWMKKLGYDRYDEEES